MGQANKQLNRPLTELTPYLCQKWRLEGLAAAEIAEILYRSRESVRAALQTPLTAAQRQTHSGLWAQFLKRGLGDELIKLQKFQSNGTLNYLNVAGSAEEVMERRPCAFDEIGLRIRRGGVIDSEYDPDQLTWADL